MRKFASLGVLILVVAGAALLWVRPGPQPVQPSPKPVDTTIKPSAPPSPKDGTVTIRTVGGSGTQEKVVKPPDQDSPFRFDDSKPLRGQVQTLLGAGGIWGKDILDACRERVDAVVVELIAILKDPSVDYKAREKALGILALFNATSAVPAIFDVARGDADARLRADAIRTLGDFLPAVKSADLLTIYAGSKTLEEKTACVGVLGNLGDPASLGFLEDLARSAPDSLLIQLSQRAADKVKVLNSPTKEVQLVQLMSDPDHPLQEWALNRIVSEKKPEMAHHLRDALDAHRKLPKNQINGTFEYQLLAGLRDLGQELSPLEKKFVENFSVENDAPLPD